MGLIALYPYIEGHFDGGFVVHHIVLLTGAPAKDTALLGVCGTIRHICHHGRSGGQLTGALSVEAHIAHGVAPHQNSVEHALNGSQLRAVIHHSRANKGSDLTASQILDLTQQLNHAAGRGHIGHIFQGDLGDTFRLHLRGIHMLAKGQGSQNAHLAAGVMALHIGGGVLLCKTVGLGQRQCICKGHILLDHLGQNKVGGAIENTGNALNMIGRQALSHGTNNGNTAAHGRLNQIIYIVGFGTGQQLRSLLRHQLLVGGDHALAAGEQLHGKVKSRVHPAHGLCHDLDLRIIQNIVKILGKERLVLVAGKLPQIQNPRQLQRLTAGALG